MALAWGKPYVDEGAEAFEKRYEQRRIQSLKAPSKSARLRTRAREIPIGGVTGQPRLRSNRIEQRVTFGVFSGNVFLERIHS